MTNASTLVARMSARRDHMAWLSAMAERYQALRSPEVKQRAYGAISVLQNEGILSMEQAGSWYREFGAVSGPSSGSISSGSISSAGTARGGETGLAIFQGRELKRVLRIAARAGKWFVSSAELYSDGIVINGQVDDSDPSPWGRPMLYEEDGTGWPQQARSNTKVMGVTRFQLIFTLDKHEQTVILEVLGQRIPLDLRKGDE